MPRIARHRVILPISGVHRGTLAALRYATSLSDDVTAVNISMDPAETEKLKAKWDDWGEGVRLVILESPYRTLLEPLLEYIEEIASQRQPNEIITIVVPQFVPKRDDPQSAAHEYRFLAAGSTAVQTWDRHHRRALPGRLRSISS